MQNNAEQIKQQEKDASKEMKVEVVNNNVQNINQTNDRRDPMYSRNVDPSYVRTVDERHGIMGWRKQITHEGLSPFVGFFFSHNV